MEVASACELGIDWQPVLNNAPLTRVANKADFFEFLLWMDNAVDKNVDINFPLKKQLKESRLKYNNELSV